MAVKEMISKLKPWFHNIHLPDGSQTAPDHFLGDFPGYKWEAISRAIPEDLSGWKALDIGCNAGFYSIELAKRGADVLAIDIDDHYLKQAEWAISHFDLPGSITLKKMQVYDLARVEREFDLVWFMGVFYHLRYPLLALDIISQKVKSMLVIQTLTMPGEEVMDTPEDMGIHDRQPFLQRGWPKMAFIEKKMSSDPTNWWAPNRACVEAMLRSCGLNATARPEPETYVARRDPSLSTALEVWNRSEYLSATGKKWTHEAAKKTHEKVNFNGSDSF